MAVMVEKRNGWIILSEYVTDNHESWIETQKYLYYSMREAKQLFKRHIKNNNWDIVVDA